MQTIGERLEEARKKRGISIREAAEATKIRGEYLQKFESNQFDIGLADIYTRGFLRNYSGYLHLPTDRILSDFGSIGGSESRVRQPSREIYGRMDLGISTSEDRAEAQAEAAAEPIARPSPRFPRPGESLPKQPAIDPATMFKLGKAALVVLGVVIVLWVGISLFPSSKPATTAPSRAQPEQAEASVPAANVTVIATDTVKIKVVKKSDGSQIFQGELQRGERRDYPNVPLFLTASELGSVQIEYKGRVYPTGHTGHDRIQFDFSNVR
jgi:cytoskeleton protein RodZ